MKQEYSEAQIDALVQPLFNALEKRMSEEDMNAIRLAYETAKKAHDGQFRKSGLPYIIHPIEVARIVGEEMMLDANSICAAFLHDVVEDTTWTETQIKEIFNDDVAFLVKVVTKVKKDKYDYSLQVDNYQQLINSINFDIRALLIKLADRLHNMRTLESMPPHKQMKIAGETDYFYAPLANRLGLYPVKIELENLSFRFRCPRDYSRLENLIEEDKKKNNPVLTAFMQKIQDKLQKENITAHVETAYRRPFSIRRKMHRNDDCFHHIDNRCFVRVVYNDNMGLTEKGMALKIYALLTDIFKEKPGSFINYIDTPKENGYQSLHVKLLADNGMWTEVHISSERMRHVSSLGCIAQRTEGGVVEWINRFRKVLKDISFHAGDIGLMEGVVCSFYNDNIVVYTPQGRPVTLPKNATALDFAFEIHTELGIHALYARINGKLSSVKTVLNHGDCVEIGKDENVVPDPSWYNCVSTYKAKSTLYRQLKQRPAPDHGLCHECHPLPGDEVIGLKNPDGTIDIHRRDCALAISIGAQRGDAVVTVELQPNENVLYPVSLHIRGIDRKHLLCDLIDCIANNLHLSIDYLNTRTVDAIVDCDITFSVHSHQELETIISSLYDISNVDEVWRQDVIN